METDIKIIPQIPENQMVTVRDWLLNCLPKGRPPIESSPELQKEYSTIYVERVVKGMSEQEIASTRGISRGKVKNAIKWCREANSNCSSVERLVDAVNTLNFRLKDLVKEQERLKNMLEAEYHALETLPEANNPSLNDTWRKIEALNRLILMQEDRILLILQKKFTIEILLGNQLPVNDTDAECQIEEAHIRDLVGFMFATEIPHDELRIIFDIVFKTARQKIAERESTSVSHQP